MKAITGTAWKHGKYWGMWFRVFGYGLCISTMEPIFSERYAYTKTVRIFGVKFKALKPEAAPQPEGG